MDNRMVDVDSGSTAEASLNWNFTFGEHFFFVVIDPLNTTPEIDKSNNLAGNFIRVFSDLTLDAYDMSYFNQTNDTVELYAVIHNMGFVNASNVSVGFFNGYPYIEDENNSVRINNQTLIAIRTIEEIAVSRHGIASLRLNLTPGMNELFALVDPFNEINETNEFNNMASNPLGNLTVDAFDTDSGTYPSISGIHNGTITPFYDINVTKLFTYSCEGTGGHTEYVAFYNSTTGEEIVNGTWDGYQGPEDYRYIEFESPFVLWKNETYNYTIRTGSYPQIIHESSWNATGGMITCTEFTDVNGNVYTDWIPAIRLD
jgi:hypothetical protein